MAFRELSPEMTTIAEIIRNYLIKNCQDRLQGVDLTNEFNSMVTIAYWDKKLLPAHRDQRYDCHGNFLADENSQKQSSPTCILAVGDTRELKLKLMRHKSPEDNATKHVKISGATESFDLDHGTLFVLHPDDEKTIIREYFHQDHKTFWQHYSSGLLKDGSGLSLGLVFRTSVHYKLVYKDTGMMVLSKAQKKTDSKKHSKNTTKLNVYLNNHNEKEKDDLKIKSLYEGMKDEHFNIN